MRLPGLAAALAGLVLASPALAEGSDCPLAHRPHASTTILADILGDPAAKAVLDRDAPGMVERFTAPFGGGPLPGGFARIITPKLILRDRPDGEAIAAKLDTDLARVAITPAASRARCAGYDVVPPRLPTVIRRPALLVFEKITGFRDAPSVAAAHAAIAEIAAQRGWSAVFSDKGAVFNPRDLARFDAVLWNNVSGDALTVPQETAFRRWIERGGGFAGVHGSGGDPAWVWDWYADTLIGARFIGHPMTPQFQAATVQVAEPGRGVARGLPASWTMTEEWYSFARSPRANGAHVVATLDEASYSPVGIGGQDLRMTDHPIAWTRCIGNGRSFYSAIGHRPENYREPNSRRLLENGIAWAMGQGATRCVGGREITSKGVGK